MQPTVDKVPESTKGRFSKHESAIIVFSLILLVTNTFLLSMSSAPSNSLGLPNGDRVEPCGDACFQVVDYLGVPVYKSDGSQRSLPMRPCEHPCHGEYLFATTDNKHFSLQLLNDTTVVLKLI